MSGNALVYNTAKHTQALANTGLFEDRRTLVVTADRVNSHGAKVVLPTSVVAALFLRAGLGWEDNDFKGLPRPDASTLLNWHFELKEVSSVKATHSGDLEILTSQILSKIAIFRQL